MNTVPLLEYKRIEKWDELQYPFHGICCFVVVSRDIKNIGVLTVRQEVKCYKCEVTNEDFFRLRKCSTYKFKNIFLSLDTPRPANGHY